MKKFIKECHDAFNKFKATRDGGEGSGVKGHKTPKIKMTPKMIKQVTENNRKVHPNYNLTEAYNKPTNIVGSKLTPEQKKQLEKETKRLKKLSPLKRAEWYSEHDM
jgi:hypothetical protein